MAKTVQGLLEHCKQALSNNVKYVYGAKMQVLTYNQIKALQNMYGKGCVWNSDLNKAGKLCCDCSGLISSYTGIARSSSNYKDTALCSISIAELNKNWNKYVGWALWMQGHIGVVSNTKGYYYAMDGSARNMVHYPMSKQKWTHCIKLCDINYEEEKVVKQNIKINGKIKTVDAINKDGYTYIKIRGLSDILNISYDKETKLISVSVK
mgnify:CR=1 FL=1